MRLIVSTIHGPVPGADLLWLMQALNDAGCRIDTADGEAIDGIALNVMLPGKWDQMVVEARKGDELNKGET